MSKRLPKPLPHPPPSGMQCVSLPGEDWSHYLTHPLLACLLLAGVTLAVYWPATTCDFVNYDDNVYVTGNSRVLAGLSLANVRWVFATLNAGFWQPLTWLSYMLDVTAFGVSARGFHLTNLLLHAANTVLLFLLFRRMTGAPWRSLFLAALFALHPLHVESVAWVSERKDVLSTFFGFLSLLFYVHYVEAFKVQSPRSEMTTKDRSAAEPQPTTAEGNRGIREIRGMKTRVESVFPVFRVFRGSSLCRRILASREQVALSRYREHKENRCSPSVKAVMRPFASGYYWLVVASFACGLMSKSILVTLPFVMLLLDYWPLKRVTSGEWRVTGGKVQSPQFRSQSPQSTVHGPQSEIRPAATARQRGENPNLGVENWRWLLLEKVPFLLLALASGVVTVCAERAMGALATADQAPVLVRAGNAGLSCCSYLLKMFWPSNLAVLYPYPRLLSVQWVTGAWLLLVLVSIFAFLSRRSRPHFAIGWFWYLLTWLPVAGLVQVGSHARADRYTYVPLIGAFIVLVWQANRLLNHRTFSRVGGQTMAGGALFILVVLTAVTRQQLSCWQNSETLFRQAVRVTQGNFLAHFNLGVELERKGQLAEALEHYREALRFNPDYAEALNNLGSGLLDQGRFDEAIACLRRALTVKPGFTKALNNLGLALAASGHYAEAVACYEAFLRQEPDDADVHFNLGLALPDMGRTDEAIAHFRRALELKSEHSADVANQLGLALLKKGARSEAITQFRAAISFRVDHADAHKNLGCALAESGQRDEAIVHLREALRLQPNSAEAAQKLRELGVPVSE